MRKKKDKAERPCWKLYNKSVDHRRNARERRRKGELRKRVLLKTRHWREGKGEG